MHTLRHFLAGALLLVLATSFRPEPRWTALLDENLSQWETYLSYRHRTDYKGQLPKDESGQTLVPIGYNKKEHPEFTVVREGGSPVLRVRGEIYGCLFTKQDYENYHLKLKVKWGKQKNDPRKNKLKDSGILYHSIGESGVDYWRSWMLSQEFQIMEGHMGDYWNIAQSAVDIRAYLPEGKMNSVASTTQPFLPFGSGAGEGYCLRSENRESPEGEWTELELITIGDKSLHIVNGTVVMVLRNSRYVKDGQSIPLTKGKIQLQSEAAEVFFKDIQIRPLTEMPGTYRNLFE
ncbi:MAG TPA: DUF1080 domain-containing protein [Chitinophagaceae bacterium]|nr:DUF1080 domain-containing protein [Chitinophagaceae bacterium]